MIRILFPALGGVLLILLAYDVLLTVFHPQGRGGPLNRAQNSAVWSLFRTLGQRKGEPPRSDLLSFCGPILAVLTIITWGLVLIAGGFLIYYPFVGSFPVSHGSADPPWVMAIYYSAYAASTLGVGDVVAPTPALRLFTVAEAFGGFILIPISVTYVLAVYRELGMATTLALDISGYFREGATKVWDRVDHARPHAFDDWADRTARSLLRITQAHSQYPILHYFHSSDPSQALLVQVGNLIRFEQLSRARHSEVGSSPSFDALRTAVNRHMHVINRDVVPPDFEPPWDRISETDLEERYRRILRYMLYEEMRKEERGHPSTSPEAPE